MSVFDRNLVKICGNHEHCKLWGFEANNVDVVVAGVYKMFYITDASFYTTGWFIDVSSLQISSVTILL